VPPYNPLVLAMGKRPAKSAKVCNTSESILYSNRDFTATQTVSMFLTLPVPCATNIACCCGALFCVLVVRCSGLGGLNGMGVDVRVRGGCVCVCEWGVGGDGGEGEVWCLPPLSVLSSHI
jgi:hypothetical protein